MAIKHLNQTEVAQRWSISHRTLERWRWIGQGLLDLPNPALFAALNRRTRGSFAASSCRSMRASHRQ